MEDNVKNEIVKASIKSDRCEVTYKESFTEGNYSNEVSKKCSQIVHADMKKALDRLKIHLIMVCEQPEAPQVVDAGIYDYDIELINNYVVTGYSIGGSDENAGVTIIGQKLLKSGSVLNLISPFIKFDDRDAYSFAGDLYGDVQACDYEVMEYLFNGKWGIKQQEFDFDTPEVMQEGVEMTVTSGGKSKKTSMKKLKELAEMNEAV
jgi:hypothetical protein